MIVRCCYLAVRGIQAANECCHLLKRDNSIHPHSGWSLRFLFEGIIAPIPLNLTEARMKPMLPKNSSVLSVTTFYTFRREFSRSTGDETHNSFRSVDLCETGIMIGACPPRPKRGIDTITA